ncbi:MAG TPA: TolC family protein [Polyangiaceae bacterium]|nr:TolC family protein [Polyangiaceae bacterium]
MNLTRSFGGAMVFGARLGWLMVAGLAAVWLTAGEARATQPLDTFVTGARKTGFDARETRAVTAQREAEAELAERRLWPTFGVRGVYTRNQYEAAAQLPGSSTRLVITPQNQFDAFFQVDLPIVDLPTRHRASAAEHQAHAAAKQQDVTGQDLERNVARLYFQFEGAKALKEAANLGIAASQANVDNVATRRSLGAATDLDYERAMAALEQSRQDLADADLMLTLSARALETASGITPQAEGAALPDDDLHSEAALERWQQRAQKLPSLDAAADRARALVENRKAADTTYYPTLAASAQERVTNATGFAGHVASYNVQLVLAWRLDTTTSNNIDAQNAQLEQNRVQNERLSRNISDAVFETYQRVQTGIARCRSTRAKLAAASRAAQLAQDRFGVGAATQLDVTLAQREAFLASAANIQANADLAYARAALRLAAGMSATDRSMP